MSNIKKITFIFPGQGSQKLNMLQDFYDEPLVCNTFKLAGEVLGYNLFELIQNDEVLLNQTEYTQPAILAASIALYRLWLKRGGQIPDYLAGHSLGEYSALVAAEVLAFEDALILVRERGRLMQQAVLEGVGAMAAILGLENEDVAKACAQAAKNEVVSPANFNAPGQVVIAGHKTAVDRAIVLCKEYGAKRALFLPVSVPSHCELMQPAANMLAQHFSALNWNAPKIPVIHNVDAQSHSDVESIQSSLTAQLSQPVAWVECVQALANAGVNLFIECGPGKVLSGLNKRILTSIAESFSLDDRTNFPPQVI